LRNIKAGYLNKNRAGAGAVRARSRSYLIRIRFSLPSGEAVRTGRVVMSQETAIRGSNVAVLAVMAESTYSDGLPELPP
jgi:hypothetical protein